MVLPAGFALPPVPYLTGLVLGLTLTGWGLIRLRPVVTDRVVVALAPWMLVGAGLHAAYQLQFAPTVVAPLLGTPAVYATTAVVAGSIWLLLLRWTDGPRISSALGLSGGVAVAFVLVWIGLEADSLHFAWPAVGVLGSVLLAAGVWIGLKRIAPSVTATTGAAGALVVFAHVLDGVSTAIGYDVLGYSERTPASRLILDVGASLPTAELIGAGWLFVAVKLLLVVGVVWLFREFVVEDPTRGYLLLAVVAAVGLGPGGQNLILYAAG